MIDGQCRQGQAQVVGNAQKLLGERSVRIVTINPRDGTKSAASTGGLLLIHHCRPILFIKNNSRWSVNEQPDAYSDALCPSDLGRVVMSTVAPSYNISAQYAKIRPYAKSVVTALVWRNHCLHVGGVSRDPQWGSC
jgi:hypothetical protein